MTEIHWLSGGGEYKMLFIINLVLVLFPYLRKAFFACYYIAYHRSLLGFAQRLFFLRVYLDGARCPDASVPIMVVVTLPRKHTTRIRALHEFHE